MGQITRDAGDQRAARRNVVPGGKREEAKSSGEGYVTGTQHYYPGELTGHTLGREGVLDNLRIS